MVHVVNMFVSRLRLLDNKGLDLGGVRLNFHTMSGSLLLRVVLVIISILCHYDYLRMSTVRYDIYYTVVVCYMWYGY